LYATCPHCERETPIPVRAELNCEYYGNKCFNLRCSRCGKVYGVELLSVVKTGTTYIPSYDKVEPDFENDEE